MSTNCIHCVVQRRSGPDGLCDDCRAGEFQRLLDGLRQTILDSDLKRAAKIVLAVGQAMLDKCNTYSPIGSLMMKLGTDDETLTVCLAKDQAAPMLATAHEALKKHLGAA